MKITVLLENTAARQDLTAEHGLSLYVEVENFRLLFDMGQTEAFASNAEKLGLDLSRVDAAVLSHGHYDHGGGLGRFLEINRHAPVYASPDAFRPHYNAAGRYIGLDEGLLDTGRIVFSRDGQSIGPGMTLRTCPLLPEDSAGLTMEDQGLRLPEDFRHEQYLLAEDGRRVLFTGCSHKGVRTLARYFRPEVLVGGFHFKDVQSPAALDRAAGDLLALPTLYYTGHCTGKRQFDVLKAGMGDRLHAFSTGMAIWL